MLNTSRALAGALCLSVSSFSAASTVWINEIHYDNAGVDRGEFVEIAGRAGLDLTDWSVALYNGSNRKRYDVLELAGIIPDSEQSGYGAVSVLAPGIQNGPDALALVDASNEVRQFISYEGMFTAVDGPAVGWASEDIGVAESTPPPVGYALALVGVGKSYADFDWSLVDTATPGVLNQGQSLSAVPLPAAFPLFGSALMGLLALARGRRSGHARSRSEPGSDEWSSQHRMRLTNLQATSPSPA